MKQEIEILTDWEIAYILSALNKKYDHHVKAEQTIMAETISALAKKIGGCDSLVVVNSRP